MVLVATGRFSLIYMGVVFSFSSVILLTVSGVVCLFLKCSFNILLLSVRMMFGGVLGLACICFSIALKQVKSVVWTFGMLLFLAMLRMILVRSSFFW